MPKILNIIIIIYNIKLEESASFKMSFERINEFSITIVDNTTIEEIRLHNKNTAEKYGVSYLTKSKNIGLSKGYNLAIDNIKKNSPETKWIITLDQDTLLNKAYFDEVEEKINNTDGTYLYYPTAASDIGIISPVLINKYYIKNIHEFADANHNLVFINSGLLMNIALFERIKYDESLFLDMIDYDLACQLIKNKQINKISNMKCTIKQDFSGANFSSFECDYSRFKLYVSDFKTFSKKWKVSTCYTYYILLKRAVKLMVHYRSLKFLLEIGKIHQ